MLQQLSDLEKLKIYMDYYITILGLNANLDPTKVGLHRFKSFEDFCAKTDDHRVSESILGWYTRFENRLIDKFNFNAENTKQRQQLFS